MAIPLVSPAPFLAPECLSRMANGLVVRQGEPTIVVAVFQNIARVHWKHKEGNNTANEMRVVVRVVGSLLSMLLSESKNVNFSRFLCYFSIFLLSQIHFFAYSHHYSQKSKFIHFRPTMTRHYWLCTNSKVHTLNFSPLTLFEAYWVPVHRGLLSFILSKAGLFFWNCKKDILTNFSVL